MATPERIREIVEQVHMDAYGEDEVMAGWEVAFQDAAETPFNATALGRPVQVLSFSGEPSRGVRALIRGEGMPQRWVGMDALDPETLPQPVRDVFEAYEEAGDV